MKKANFPTRLIKVSVYSLLFIFAAYFLYSCKKDEAGTDVIEKEEAAKISTKGKPKSSTARYSEGPCPYPCGDGRCDLWSEPSPDCPGGGGGSTPATDTIALITNPNNHMEVVGVDHNDGMRAIMPLYENGALQPTQENVFANTRSYMIRKGYDEATYVNTYNWTVQNGYYNFDFQPKLDVVISKAYSEGYISPVGRDYLNRLAGLIASLDNSIAPTSTTYSNFANKVITYENEIRSAFLNSDEKNILLSVHSVARFSANYWMNYHNENTTLVAVRTAGGGWFNWKDCLGDDVAGGIGGAIGGALTGAMAGGAGAGPGALVGGVGGAVGTSATNAVKQVWNRYF